MLENSKAEASYGDLLREESGYWVEPRTQDQCVSVAAEVAQWYLAPPTGMKAMLLFREGAESGSDEVSAVFYFGAEDEQSRHNVFHRDKRNANL